MVCIVVPPLMTELCAVMYSRVHAVSIHVPAPDRSYLPWLPGLNPPDRLEKIDSSGTKSIVDSEYDSCACSPIGKLKGVSQPAQQFQPGASRVQWKPVVRLSLLFPRRMEPVRHALCILDARRHTHGLGCREFRVGDALYLLCLLALIGDIGQRSALVVTRGIESSGCVRKKQMPASQSSPDLSCILLTH